MRLQLPPLLPCLNKPLRLFIPSHWEPFPFFLFVLGLADIGPDFFIPRFFLCTYCGLPPLQLLVPTDFNLRYVYDEQQKFHEVLVFLTAWVLKTAQGLMGGVY